MASIFERQSELLGVISRAIENVKKIGETNRTRGVIQGRLEALHSNWNKFQENHEKLLTLKTDAKDKTVSESNYFTDGYYALCEEQFLTSKGFLLDLLDRVPKPSTSSTMENTSESGECSSDLKTLPQIPLPQFSGEYSEWSQFRDLFTSMVKSKSNLTNVEKLHYLKMSVKGEPQKLLKNITVTSENFSRAWQTLVQRYENKRLLVNSHLSTIFDIRRVTRESASELKRVLDDTKEAVGALESLGRPTKHWDDLLVYNTVQKLDCESLKEWEKRIGESTDPSTFTDLESFLIGRIHTLEALEQANTRNARIDFKPKPKAMSTRAHNASTNKEQHCTFCNGAHYIASCTTYRAQNPEQRRSFVIAKQLCFNCLGPHQIRVCRSTKRCNLCNKNHHTLLHDTRSSNVANQDVPLPTNNTSRTSCTDPQVNRSSLSSAQLNDEHLASHTAHPDITRRTPVLLATAMIYILGANGEERPARALLDQGSEASFITEALVQQLRLPRRQATIPIIRIGAQSSGSTRGIANVRFSSRFRDFECAVNALILPRLTSYLPSFRFVPQKWRHLEGLPLADPSYAHPNEIDMVLGADIYGRILEDAVRKAESGSPIAQKTALGWILSGPMDTSSITSVAAIHGLQCSTDYALLDLMQRFWIQEEPSTTKSTLPEEEEKCEQHFVETHSRDETGRYIVRLPLKVQTLALGDSYTSASRLLKRMENRFQRDREFHREYSKFMHEYRSLGHMCPISNVVNVTDSKRMFYLPHHGVLRETSITTKLRVVFNGSQKTTTGVSLNDYLYVGPKLQSELSDVLLRWRRHIVVFCADIEKMFRQIRLHRDDWDLQRVLWRDNSHMDVQPYHLCTVTYGLTCAPYLALRVLQQLAKDEEDSYPLASSVLRSSTYVDDILAGSDTIEEAKHTIQQLISMLKAGGFTLQKWASNEKDVLFGINNQVSNVTINECSNEYEQFRALGLSWIPRTDNFVFASSLEFPSPTASKRTILSFISRLFDPLGWLAPITIRAKMFMQELWLHNLEWDQKLPSHLSTKWNSIIQDYKDVNRICIPRWIGTSGSSNVYELHGFSDASREALAAVVYVRVLHDDETIRVTLASAKTKVAPLKKVTIPRLELSAALLLSRLVLRVKNALEMETAPVHLWTDSSVTLAWIQGHSSRWKEYVSNRVAEIQGLPNSRWHHVPGTENPADCASRGVSSRELAQYSAWWNGPSWLSKPSTSWPSSRATLPLDVDLEERPIKVNLTIDNESTLRWELIDRYSNLTRLLRITAWCQRAVGRFQGNDRQKCLSPLTPMELDQARLFWIKETQRIYFPEAIKLLKQGSELPRNSSLQRLTPYLDKEGALRVGGRLNNANISEDRKHPFILPRISTLTTLIIGHTHRRTLHGGTQLTLATLRQTYWILGGRNPVRTFIHRCLSCVRQRAVTGSQLMGQLPSSRVSPSRPFLNAGVDYAGPLTLRTFRGRGAKTYKGYIAVFLCLSSSAIHLEAVTDYSTDGFLAAFKRFTSRRGICATLMSDCGTNFVGADTELRRLFNSTLRESNVIANALANDGTKWHFIPPSAPHFGGKWEAGVKSVKFHLKRVIGDTTLTYEELSTLLAQVEAILNSRPLCALSDDPSDLSVLTPGHFLIGSALNIVPEPSLELISKGRLSRWQMIRQTLEHFWYRWQTEYLNELQQRNKWKNQSPSFKVGDLVLVKDERYPPSKWPKGRVTQVYPGADGLIRVVSVKTATTEYKRPIVKLVYLPVSTET